MWEWMKWLLGLPVEPTVAIKPEPVSVNPTPNERQKRNLARIERLKYAVQHGDTRPALLAELARREHGGR